MTSNHNSSGTSTNRPHQTDSKPAKGTSKAKIGSSTGSKHDLSNLSSNIHDDASSILLTLSILGEQDLRGAGVTNDMLEAARRVATKAEGATVSFKTAKALSQLKSKVAQVAVDMKEYNKKYEFDVTELIQNYTAAIKEEKASEKFREKATNGLKNVLKSAGVDTKHIKSSADLTPQVIANLQAQAENSKLNIKQISKAAPDAIYTSDIRNQQARPKLTHLKNVGRESAKHVGGYLGHHTANISQGILSGGLSVMGLRGIDQYFGISENVVRGGIGLGKMFLNRGDKKKNPLSDMIHDRHDNSDIVNAIRGGTSPNSNTSTSNSASGASSTTGTVRRQYTRGGNAVSSKEVVLELNKVNHKLDGIHNLLRKQYNADRHISDDMGPTSTSSSINDIGHGKEDDHSWKDAAKAAAELSVWEATKKYGKKLLRRFRPGTGAGAVEGAVEGGAAAEGTGVAAGAAAGGGLSLGMVAPLAVGAGASLFISKRAAGQHVKGQNDTYQDSETGAIEHVKAGEGNMDPEVLKRELEQVNGSVKQVPTNSKPNPYGAGLGNTKFSETASTRDPIAEAAAAATAANLRSQMSGGGDVAKVPSEANGKGVKKDKWGNWQFTDQKPEDILKNAMSGTGGGPGLTDTPSAINNNSDGTVPLTTIHKSQGYLHIPDGPSADPYTSDPQTPGMTNSQFEKPAYTAQATTVASTPSVGTNVQGNNRTVDSDIGNGNPIVRELKTLNSNFKDLLDIIKGGKGVSGGGGGGGTTDTATPSNAPGGGGNTPSSQTGPGGGGESPTAPGNTPRAPMRSNLSPTELSNLQAQRSKLVQTQSNLQNQGDEGKAGIIGNRIQSIDSQIQGGTGNSTAEIQERGQQLEYGQAQANLHGDANIGKAIGGQITANDNRMSAAGTTNATGGGGSTDPKMQGGGITKGSLAKNQQEAYNAARGEGYSDSVARAMVANLSGESLRNPADTHHDPSRTNPNQMAHGIASWDDARSKAIKDKFGKMPNEMSVGDQMRAHIWEINNTKRFRETKQALASGDPDAIQRALVHNYEASGSQQADIQKRTGIRQGLEKRDFDSEYQKSASTTASGTQAQGSEGSPAAASGATNASQSNSAPAAGASTRTVPGNSASSPEDVAAVANKIKQMAGHLSNEQCVTLAREYAGIPGTVKDWRRGESVESGNMKPGTPLATFLDRKGKLSDKYDGGVGVGKSAKEVIAESGGKLHAGTTHALVFNDYTRDKNGKITGFTAYEQYKGSHGIHLRPYTFGDKRGGEKDASNYYGINDVKGVPMGRNNPSRGQSSKSAPQTAPSNAATGAEDTSINSPANKRLAARNADPNAPAATKAAANDNTSPAGTKATAPSGAGTPGRISFGGTVDDGTTAPASRGSHGPIGQSSTPSSNVVPFRGSHGPIGARADLTDSRSKDDAYQAAPNRAQKDDAYQGDPGGLHGFGLNGPDSGSMDTRKGTLTNAWNGLQTPYQQQHDLTNSTPITDPSRVQTTLKGQTGLNYGSGSDPASRTDNANVIRQGNAGLNSSASDPAQRADAALNASRSSGPGGIGGDGRYPTAPVPGGIGSDSKYPFGNSNVPLPPPRPTNIDGTPTITGGGIGSDANFPYGNSNVPLPPSRPSDLNSGAGLTPSQAVQSTDTTIPTSSNATAGHGGNDPNSAKAFLAGQQMSMNDNIPSLSSTTPIADQAPSSPPPQDTSVTSTGQAGMPTGGTDSGGGSDSSSGSTPGAGNAKGGSVHHDKSNRAQHIDDVKLAAYAQMMFNNCG